jgi:hypothetical protein
MLNNSEQELDKLDEFKSAQSIHDAVEKGNFSGQARRARTRKELDGVSCFT